MQGLPVGGQRGHATLRKSGGPLGSPGPWLLWQDAAQSFAEVYEAHCEPK